MSKRNLTSLIGASLIGGHIALCPLHGLAWKAGLATTSAIPAIAQSPFGEASSYLHDKQVEFVADAISLVGADTPTLEVPSYLPTQVREHLEDHSPKTYQRAHAITTYGNYALMGLLLLPFVYGAGKKVRHLSSHKQTQNE